MEETRKILPFIEYNETRGWESYPDARDVIDERTTKNYIDEDNDFAIGDSGGFLPKYNFKFKDTHLFNEAARTYEANYFDPDIQRWVEALDIPVTHARDKYFYCPHPYASAQYNSFWKRETSYRRNGMIKPCRLNDDGTITDLHITGDHYHYLNYGRIMRTPTEPEREELHGKGDYKTEQVEGFPRFWDGDYWNFKTDFFIQRNNFHLAKGKARGKGYSYKRGAQAANTLNLIPKATVVLAAFDIDYLTDPGATSDMVKTNLDFLENATHWKRFYIKEDLEALQLGYRTKAGGNKKFGFLSRLLSVTTRNNESAAIGKRAIEIDYEEAGRAPNLEEFLDVTLSSTEVGAGNVGTIRVYGTAGTKEANWVAFGNVFYNPGKYKMMPFENIHDYQARTNTCGFFHPQIWNLEPFMDVDGNSQLRAAWEYDIADKKKQAAELTVEKYIAYEAQRANTPEEAFRRGGENLFTSIELSEHVSRVIDHREVRYFRDGTYVDEKDGTTKFITNSELIDKGMQHLAHPYIEAVPFSSKRDILGCVREYYPPVKDANGKVPEGTYVGLLDPMGKDKKSDMVYDRNSLISWQIWMLPNNTTGTRGDIMVAAYAGRPERMEEGDRLFLKALEQYNAKGLPEVDRGETVSNFKKWGKLNRLMKDPTVALTAKQEEVLKAPWGVNMGSSNNSLDSLEYLRDMLYEKFSVDEDGKPIYLFHYITDIPSLKELVSFSIDGNFDRISTMKLYALLRKALKVKKRSDIIKKAKAAGGSIFSRIGLYGHGK